MPELPKNPSIWPYVAIFVLVAIIVIAVLSLVGQAIGPTITF